MIKEQSISTRIIGGVFDKLAYSRFLL